MTEESFFIQQKQLSDPFKERKKTVFGISDNIGINNSSSPNDKDSNIKEFRQELDK